MLRQVTIHLLKQIGAGYSELKSLQVYADVLLTEANEQSGEIIYELEQRLCAQPKSRC